MTLRYLQLERPGRSRSFGLGQRLGASFGLALGVVLLLLAWGFLGPLERMVKERILGSLPDRIRVTGTSVSMGPVALGGGLDSSTVATLQSIEGVAEVYRQAHYPEPSKLTARYAGEGLVTDLVLEMVDEGQVAAELARGRRFVDPGPGQDIPAVVPQAILDLVNSGIQVNTNLPQLTASALIGKHFTLHLGTSSFRPGPSRTVRCVIVGISSQIGAGGPAIPYDAGLRLTKEEPKLHTLTVRLEDPVASARVESEVRELGLRTPSRELAQRVETVAAVLRLATLILPLAVALVTAFALSALLQLQVRRERPLIALYRALGATRKQVGRLYLLRGLSVGIAGFAIGLAGGLIGGRVLALWLESQLPFELLSTATLFMPTVSAFVWSALLGLIVPVGAAYLPARQAAEVEPAQVFREP